MFPNKAKPSKNNSLFKPSKSKSAWIFYCDTAHFKPEWNWLSQDTGVIFLFFWFSTILHNNPSWRLKGNVEKGCRAFKVHQRRNFTIILFCRQSSSHVIINSSCRVVDSIDIRPCVKNMMVARNSIILYWFSGYMGLQSRLKYRLKSYWCFSDSRV